MIMNNNLPKGRVKLKGGKNGYIGKVWRYYQGKHKCIAGKNGRPGKND
jgi:hypothetical protein